jgi:adenosylhomocysteine nucleosidase
LTAEAALLKGRYLAEAGGGTPAGAMAAVQRLKGQGATAIISFGLAGGLNPALAPGTLMVPHTIIDGSTRWSTDPLLTARLGGATGHITTGAPAIIATAAAKATLFAATHADAVDLESVAAVHSGLPFAVLRAIADPADRNLPPAALIPLRPSGAIDLPRILLAVIRHPAQIAALIAIGKDAARASTTLSSRIEMLKS